MAQHDYSIANQGFPAFRSDLNNGLAAIVSNNSGATEPTTMFAHQIWVDTAANPSLLKLRNADNDAWITIGSIDQTGDTFTMVNLKTSGPVVFNDAGANVDFRVEGDTEPNLLFVDASADKVGVGTNAPATKLHVYNATQSLSLMGSATSFTNPYDAFGSQNISALQIISANTAGASLQLGYTGTGSGDSLGSVQFITNGTSGDEKRGAMIASVLESSAATSVTGNLQFSTTNAGTLTERMRITSAGRVRVGNSLSTTNWPQAASSPGVNESQLENDGVIAINSNAVNCLYINRNTSDGDLVRFYSEGVQEGSISVSGNTVSYNAFSGGHWSQLQEGRGYNPDIPCGTVMSSIGEMCEWKSVEWTETTEHPAIPAVEAKEAVLDEEGNVIEPAVEAIEGKDAWTETSEKREAYFGDLPVGATFEEDGFTKTVVDDGNERLPKVKISDVAGDKAVYGVFQTWDDVQDMLVTSLGAFVVRIAAGVTVEIGDLLESNGDGCAKVQDDDVIRSKTIAKVTSTTPTETYDDGSYTVPAVIYCG